MSDPVISVVVAAHNAEATIGRAVLSVLQQSLQDIEVVVVDDASCDATIAALDEAAGSDGRVRRIRLETNQGPSAARNRGVSAARGRWIALLDADDWYARERLATLVTVAEAQAGDVVSDNLQIYDEDGRDLGPMFEESNPLPSTISALRFIQGNMPDPAHPRVGMGFLKPVFRSDFLRRHNLRYDEGMRFAEDYRFYLEVLLSGARWITHPAAGYAYTVRSSSLTAQHEAIDLQRLCAADHALLARPAVQDNHEVRAALLGHLVSTEERLQWAVFGKAAKAGDWPGAWKAATFSGPVFRYVASNCLRWAAERSLRLIRTRHDAAVPERQA